MEPDVTKPIIFQTFMEFYVSLSTVSALPNTMVVQGCMVQESGKGDSTNFKNIVAEFHNCAGKDWTDLCRSYAPPAPLSDSFVNRMKGIQAQFWKRLRRQGLYRQSRNYVEHWLDTQK